MIEIKIPFQNFAKINGIEKCKGQKIISDTSSNIGVFDYIDVLGICRTKRGRDITTVHQANVILQLNNEDELIDAIKKYKPSDLWF